VKKITIAIDGYSSTGKSTLAKQIAKELGYVYVDTGAMYRAITFFAMQNGYINADSFDKQTLINSLPSIKLHFEFNSDFGFAEMYLNGVNVEKEIRSLNVSNFVSKIAEVSEVRAKLVEQQQEMGKNKAIVMDGRDIGTVVFPNAELKIFMTASPETRAQRRFDELQAKGDTVTFEEIFKNVQERDNSHLTREEQYAAVLEMANEVINS
jgi:CMP/dCMP kinase